MVIMAQDKRHVFNFDVILEVYLIDCEMNDGRRIDTIRVESGDGICCEIGKFTNNQLKAEKCLQDILKSLSDGTKIYQVPSDKED